MFNSLNPQGVPLKCVVRKNSGHLAFWSEARKEISKMFFRKRGSEERKIPSSLSNWLVTLKSFATLSKELQLKGITFFAPRSINQDPIEIFLDKYVNMDVGMSIRHAKILKIASKHC
ncbi:hypothetical protein CBL_20245 [Carabus blaptoides fortunei]